MREIQVVRDYYIEDKFLYETDKFTFNPGVTVLVGCNGCGKTTLLNQIQQHLKKGKIPCAKYDNLYHGGNNAKEKAGFYGDMALLATLAFASEGEQIATNLGTFSMQLGNYIRENKNEHKEIWILLDAIDSGLSVDNIIEVKEYLFDFVLKDCTENDVYIIVSANEYEMANGEDCINVITGKHHRFNDYNEYRDLIISSKAKKDKRGN